MIQPPSGDLFGVGDVDIDVLYIDMSIDVCSIYVDCPRQVENIVGQLSLPNVVLQANGTGR